MNKRRITGLLRNPLVLTLLSAAAGLTLYGFWFFSQHEKKAVEIQQNMSPAARRNPLLAAERYLLSMGKAARSEQGLALFKALPPAQDTAIFVRHLPMGLSPVITDRLYRWVESGGDLLVVYNPFSDDHHGPGNFFQTLGVDRVKKDKDADCDCEPQSEPAHTETESEADSDISEKADGDDGFRPYERRVEIEIGTHAIQLGFSGNPRLEDTKGTATWRVGNAYRKFYHEEADRTRSDHNQTTTHPGAWILRFDIGQGTVTVLSDLQLFHNRRIGRHDHAFLLSWLVRDAHTVWLLYESGMDPLFKILWQKAPYAWISLVILTGLVIWKVQKRGGTLQRPSPDRRRNILAHIEATGWYAWRSNRSASLITANRQRLQRKLARHTLGRTTRGPIPAKAWQRIAKTFGLSDQERREAFQSEIENEPQVIRVTRTMQKIVTLIQGGETKYDGTK